ncbi:FAD binding domain-containing protein [Cohnella candidum]|uniref:Molybdopterin dehydrogenase n=1 Tax=Cohnella candidum TaxID=2674991 RepID=A0A3G3JZS1_9BACL|nr:FAD binding domain-containing protein [Cohnella candidum]AYQ73371.1 molybdopterin dehydrogenase [Cohnella candidum]
MAMKSPGVTRLPDVWMPRSAAEAWSLKRNFGSDAEYVAGGTLLRTWWEGDIAERPAHLIDIRSLPGLSGIRSTENGGTVIGAGTSLTSVRRSGWLASRYPALTEAAFRIGALSIRNAGTIGGNAASGIGDLLPALLVYEAGLLWYDGQEELIPAEKWLEHPETYRTPEKLLVHVRLPSHPKSGAGAFSAFRKVGRREAFTPSVVTAALSAEISEEGRLGCVRIAAGGGSTVPQRLYAAEALMEGRRVEPELLAEVHGAVEKTFRPKGDAFAGEAYRKRTAANLIAAEWWKLARGQGEE